MGEVVYGPAHARSTLGVLKLCEIVLCLLAVILAACQGYTHSDVAAFYAGTIIGIIVSLVILVLSLTEAGHSLNGILKYQFAVHLILFIYLVIASSILMARWPSRLFQAAGSFGIISSVVYLLDAGASYRAYDVRFT